MGIGNFISSTIIVADGLSVGGEVRSVGNIRCGSTIFGRTIQTDTGGYNLICSDGTLISNVDFSYHHSSTAANSVLVDVLGAGAASWSDSPTLTSGTFTGNLDVGGTISGDGSGLTNLSTSTVVKVYDLGLDSCVRSAAGTILNDYFGAIHFADEQSQTVGYTIPFPNDIQTGSTIAFDVYYTMPNSGSTGTIFWESGAAMLTAGSVIGDFVAREDIFVSVTGSTANYLYTTSTMLPVLDYTKLGIHWGFRREGADVADTYVKGVDVRMIRMKYIGVQ